MAPKIYVSQNGLASCPGCLNHIRLEPTPGQTVCPFCGETLHVAARAPEQGQGALKSLQKSRSGLVATALAGAGLSLTLACTEPEPDDDNDNQWSLSEDAGDDSDADGDVDVEEYEEEENIYADYGDYPNDFNGDPNTNSGDVDAGQDDDADAMGG